jgi:hypothetical protein
LNTTFLTEEMSITQNNVMETGAMLKGEMHAEALGVKPDKAIKIIEAIGNYGESCAKYLTP